MTGSGRGPVLPSTAVRRRPPPFLPGAVVVAAGLAVAAVAGAACSRRDTSASTRFDAGPPPRRVIGAPPRQVRALPPYAISVDGVGPYRLGVPLTQVLSALPSGPRMTLLQIPGMLDYSVVRDEGLLVGGERQGAASFIAVVAPEIARTEAGLGVGASQDAVVRDLGPALAAPAVAADPALWRGARLPGATFLVEAGRVSGVLITDPPGRAAIGRRSASWARRGRSSRRPAWGAPTGSRPAATRSWSPPAAPAGLAGSPPSSCAGCAGWRRSRSSAAATSSWP